jgi:hypothetical protein
LAFGGVALSITMTVYLSFAAAVVGVPLMTPVAGSMARPCGKPRAVHLRGGVPPAAVIVVEG